MNNADNLNQKVIRFFEPFFEKSIHGIEFSYGCNTKAKEIWKSSGFVDEIPQGIWTAYHQLPISIAHLFIASNCTDTLCFAHFFPQYVEKKAGVAFSSFGYLPNKENFRELICKFPNAKIHLIFENSLLGRIFDCKIALLKHGIDSKISINGNFIQIEFHGQTLELPIERFSLNYFEVISSKRFPIRTYKPAKGFLNFHKLFTAI
ncbi:hypothetical protein IQ31_05099 [Sphingobacterium siyangense]|uniref:Uncharacterized protein n=1 Tax=Sphingobacterium siyangense TaxID=459529 RepID=A0A562M6F4_9SPHI|nr:hypothetical protein IQ31_05099 [Sphingobacterium siyangense]